MVKLVTGELIIKAMNTIADEEEQSALEPVRQRVEEIAENQQSASLQEVDVQEGEEEQEGVRQGTVEDTFEGDQPEEKEGQAESEETKEEEVVAELITTRSGRVVNRPSRFMAVTKISRKDWKLQEVEKAIKEEIKMLFGDLKALRAVKRASIKAGTKILKSHMFVVAKHLASGEFDKMKARLVADGRDQEPGLYPDKSSPTVAIHSVFTVLGLMAEKPWRVTVKIDIKGAFVQTPMKGESTYMRLDKSLTEHVINLFPDLKELVEADGSLYTLMLKAMYGCIQASALWYALIKKFLEDQGYQVSETDRCVFRKRKGDRIFILLLYVDDILANVDSEEAEKLRKSLIKRFGTVQFEIGGRLSYLGMQLEMKETGTVIDMTFYVKQLLEDVDVPVRASPGTKLTFMIAENAKALTEVDRKVFHTQVAKLLFLSKRARPDILTVVSFLCTRVQTATTEDQAKLNRVLGYLKGTQDRVLLLRSQEKSEVRAYVDAAYALHNDSKSHSGVALYVGKTLVYVSSKKQKCMSKSPTEAELIALTDNLGMVELFQEFVEFLTMSKQKPATIYQDCSAVVTLVTKGGGITRTKHLRARMNLGKEAVEEKRAFIVHVSAEEMKADGFSKPYDPAEHKPFAEMIQGETG